MKKITIDALEKDKQQILQDIQRLDTNRVMAQGVLTYLNQKIKELKGADNGT